MQIAAPTLPAASTTVLISTGTSSAASFTYFCASTANMYDTLPSTPAAMAGPPAEVFTLYDVPSTVFTLPLTIWMIGS